MCERFRFGAAVIVAAVGAAVGGCGGSSNSPLSKAQLAARANPICESLRTEALKIQVPRDFTSNPAAAAAYLDQLVKLVGDQYTKLKALTPDSHVKADYHDYLASIALDVVSLKMGAAKARAKDPSGLADLRDEGIHSRDITAVEARNLGFSSCARQ